jgi:UDP-glucose:(heptosyl)LPS alpha-1,3-glucosyltransferase
MKILLIRKQYNFVGGAERYIEALLGELVHRGVEPHLLCREWAGMHPPDLRIHHMPDKRLFHFWENVAFARQARQFVQRGYGYDVVFSLERTMLQDIYRAGDGLHEVWVERKKQFSTPMERIALALNPLHVTTGALERRTFDPECTGYVIANSPMVKREIAERTAFPESRVEVIPNGVDTSKFTPVEGSRKQNIRRVYNIPQDKFVFLLVGSGFFRKGVRQAIDFVKRLRRPDAMLWVVGRGTLPANSDPQLVRHQMSATSISDIYRAADAFLLPTLYDPFANVTLEAMASGLPVITTAYNGASDFIKDGDEGWVWSDLKDFDSIIERIQPLFKPEIRESMGIVARARAEQFTLSRNVEATLGFIRKVIGANYGAPKA